MIKRVTPRKATNVNVALQTDFDQRLQHEFSPSLTLYEILEHWESNSEGIYKGKIICKVPVVIHMTQEICGIKNLKDTTLESLGLIRGNIVLRLVHREEESCGTCSLSEDSVETAKVRQEQQKVFIRSQDQAQPSKPTNVDVTTSGCNVLESAAQTSQSSAEVSFQKENSVEPSQKRPKLQEESSVEKAPDVGGVPLAEALKDEDIHRVTQTVRPFQQFKELKEVKERTGLIVAVNSNYDLKARFRSSVKLIPADWQPSQKRPKLQEESSVEKAPDVGGVPLAEALKDEDIHRVTQTVRPFQQFKIASNRPGQRLV
eukprot:gene9223-16906_t